MKLILACDPSGGIGYQNRLPWDKIQGDLPRFKQLTQNQVIVMGRRTWESLPTRPLNGRLNIIVTRLNLSLPAGAIAINSLNNLGSFTNAWVIGGASLVQSNWELFDTIHLTRTFTEYACDKFIDLVQLENDFDLESIENNEDHSYEVWKRK